MLKNHFQKKGDVVIVDGHKKEMIGLFEVFFNRQCVYSKVSYCILRASQRNFKLS